MFSFLKPRRKTPLPPPQDKGLHRIIGPTMGTEFRVTFAAPDLDETDLAGRLFRAVDAVDQAMSTWKPASALSQFNRAPLDKWVAVPADLARVVAAGLGVSAATQGAFDMTLGLAVNAWGFGPERSVPDAAAIAALSHTRQASAGERLELDRRRPRHGPRQHFPRGQPGDRRASAT